MVEWQALSVIGKKAPGGRTLSFGFLFLPESHGPRNFSQDPLPVPEFFPEPPLRNTKFSLLYHTPSH